jgi:hypothetical protein
MVRKTKNKVLADNRETVEAAMAYGKEKGIETENIEIINHWEVSVPKLHPVLGRQPGDLHTPDPHRARWDHEVFRPAVPVPGLRGLVEV